MLENRAAALLVGSDILNLVTTGMYQTPLAIYREYLQNAADAIGSSAEPRKGRVDITVNPGRRSIKIRDNGPGLTHAEAKRELIPVARSCKQRGTYRGFRGIGRLSGLAFADRVAFRTRSCKTQPVTQVTWNGTVLRADAVQSIDPNQIVRNCVEVSRIKVRGWPNHFFEVEIENVARHAAGQVLNREAVRGYIGEVCPVPMAEDFPFASEVEDLFDQDNRPLALEVVLEGENEPVRRPHGSVLKFSEERTDRFLKLEPLRIPGTDGGGDAAIGWIAHSSYLGAIPKELGVRGLRVREGNIQIGQEDVFDPLFRDDRFNRWCVGELHVLDARILPNGRRDYFEPGPRIRHIENHLEAIIRRLVGRCRSASLTRHRARKLQMTLEHMESAYTLADSGYLTAEDARALIEQTLQNVQRMEESFDAAHPDQKKNMAELKRLIVKLRDFRPRRGRPKMGKVRSQEIETYQRIFRALTELSPSPSAAKKMIEEVLAYT